MRAAYIIQLLVSIVSPTSKNLADLFAALKSNAVLFKNLRQLDSCLLSQEAMLAGWKKAFTSITAGGQFAIRAVLVTCTPLAEQLMQHNDGSLNGESAKGANESKDANKTSTRGYGEDGDSDIEGAVPNHILLRMNDLITYGFGGKDKLSELPDAHTLARFQLHLQALVLEHANDVEQQWRDSLMLVIAKPDEEPSTSARRKSPTTKAELLLRVPDDAQLLRCSNDSNLERYRLPKTNKLVFLGSVGYLAKSKH